MTRITLPEVRRLPGRSLLWEARNCGTSTALQEVRDES